MKSLSVDDVERIVRLVSDAADPTFEIPVLDRKRLLVSSVAQMVGADVWIWTNGVFNPQTPGDAWTVGFIDGGWASEQERTAFMHILSRPEMREAQAVPELYLAKHHVTVGRHLFIAALGEKRLDAIWGRTEMPFFLISYYPVGDLGWSVVGLYRRREKPDFSDRDRLVVHVVFQQVEWLHRHGHDVPAQHKVLDLTPREREVLIFLMGGDSLKQVAHRLQLSEHTIGDYVKHIYKRFGVSSRAELLAHFIAGGQRQETPSS